MLFIFDMRLLRAICPRLRIVDAAGVGYWECKWGRRSIVLCRSSEYVSWIVQIGREFRCMGLVARRKQISGTISFNLDAPRGC